VNYGADGYLPNDHRHQFKIRGSYGFLDGWRVGVTLDAQSGRPISAFGTRNPFDSKDYHSFFICTANCDPDSANPVYELFERGSGGRTPWIYDLSANVTWQHAFGPADVLVKLAVYNLLNQERALEVDEQLNTTVTTSEFYHDTYGRPTTYESPRYGQLTLQVKF
jgi:outer membrane receptor protein involved in Fe transport